MEDEVGAENDRHEGVYHEGERGFMIPHVDVEGFALGDLSADIKIDVVVAVDGVEESRDSRENEEGGGEGEEEFFVF